jgi:Flp pilus assembly protein TadD
MGKTRKTPRGMAAALPACTKCGQTGTLQVDNENALEHMKCSSCGEGFVLAPRDGWTLIDPTGVVASFDSPDALRNSLPASAITPVTPGALLEISLARPRSISQSLIDGLATQNEIEEEWESIGSQAVVNLRQTEANATVEATSDPADSTNEKNAPKSTGVQAKTSPSEPVTTLDDSEFESVPNMPASGDVPTWMPLAAFGGYPTIRAHAPPPLPRRASLQASQGTTDSEAHTLPTAHPPAYPKIPADSFPAATPTMHGLGNPSSEKGMLATEAAASPSPAPSDDVAAPARAASDPPFSLENGYQRVNEEDVVEEAAPLEQTPALGSTVRSDDTPRRNVVFGAEARRSQRPAAREASEDASSLEPVEASSSTAAPQETIGRRRPIRAAWTENDDDGLALGPPPKRGGWLAIVVVVALAGGFVLYLQQSSQPTPARSSSTSAATTALATATTATAATTAEPAETAVTTTTAMATNTSAPSKSAETSPTNGESSFPSAKVAPTSTAAAATTTAAATAVATTAANPNPTTASATTTTGATADGRPAADASPDNGLPTNELLHRAHASLRRGDKRRAEQQFRLALSKEPGNVEAVTGLGDIARSGGDLAAARDQYQRAIDRSPSYVPALLALADVNWELGDKKAARSKYAAIVDKLGDRAPQRAKERAN